MSEDQKAIDAARESAMECGRAFADWWKENEPTTEHGIRLDACWRGFRAGWYASEHRRASGWLTIESAPRDGRLVLLWNDGGKEPFLARWHEHGWRNNHYGPREGIWVFGAPTHWQPIPKPPG